MDERGRTVNLEFTTRCTLGCLRCLRTLRPGDFNIQDMSFDVIDRITDRDDLDSVSLCGTYGDPIYHREFHKALEIVVNKGLNVFLATNGTGRPLGWWSSTVDLMNRVEGSVITFSVDGLEDTNHIYRVNAKWDQIYAAMEFCAPRIETIWKWIVFSHNQHQIDQGYEEAEKLGMEFRIVKSSRYGRVYSRYQWEDDPLKPDDKYVRKWTSQ